MNDTGDFDVAFSGMPDSETIILTSYFDSISKKENDIMASAFDKYVNQSDIHYSAYTKDNTSIPDITIEWLDSIAYDIHNNPEAILNINALIRQRIVVDDIIGRTYEALVANTTTNYTLNYAQYDKNRNKNKTLQRAKEIIDSFNKQVNLKALIRECIPLTYAEGNRILYLRSKNGRYVIDSYPLNVATITEYTINKMPICQISIDDLKKGLNKTYKKTKKQAPLIFKNVEDDIRNNYPPEVYKAFKDGERFVNLDPRYCRTMRFNNLGRRYGVSPIFKALRPSLVLDNTEKADILNSKAKGKKIIHQIMRKEILGTDGKQKGLVDMAFAHDQLMSAWRNKTVVYTSPPAVEKIVYVEPSASDSTAEKLNSYRSRIMTALGIGFVDATVDSFSVANISLDQLMKVVNAIAEQFETIMESYYEIVLEENGIDPLFAPAIKVFDSEQMSLEMRKTLATTLIGTFNSSYKTAFETLGYSFEEEVRRRTEENERGVDEVFTPHASQYTSGSGSEQKDVGRPSDSKNLDKKAYDNDRNS